jgi:hypothetical protein
MAEVRRDHAWIEREYGTEKWPLARAAIAAIAPGPPPTRVLGAVLDELWPRLDDPEPVDVVVDGRRTRLPLGAALGAFTQLIVTRVLAAARPDTGLVVELGSGWGRNLAEAWLAGGPADAEYVAAEYTAAGREATDALAPHLPGQRLTSRAFDYHRPDLADLRRDAGHAVVFSVHSLEQIPHVAPALLDEILALAPAVTVVHVEPVGWQLPGAGDREGTSAGYAERNDYNRDLIAVLREAEAAGRLAIEDARAEVLGINPDNSSSVVVWSKRP